MKEKNLIVLAAIALSIGFGLTGCKQEATPPPSLDSPYRVQFSASSATKTLTGLVNQDVYLVRVNKSNVNVDGANTGSVAASSPSSHSQVRQEIAPSLRSLSSARPMMDLPEALAWKPSEAVVQAQREHDALNAAARNEGGPARAFVDYVVGTSTKSWWVNNPTWAEMPTTLRAQGAHCNVWVANVDYYVDGERVAGDGKVSSADAIALKDKFDLLYPIETKLLGYEFGGDPARPDELGGRDRDERIQILVYKSYTPYLGGYYWAKDYYTQAVLDSDGIYTNYAEIFYLNSIQIVPSDLSYMYSTLAHEFQHMINFNVKSIRSDFRIESESWYNEMLSMLTEDVMDSFLGVASTNASHPIQERMPGFLATYNDYALEEWPPNAGGELYPKNYAFGAYLVRNFGGPSLMNKILANDTANVDSISAALAEITPGMDFQHALDRYAEALVLNSPDAGVISFNHTITETIDGIMYRFDGFDIWNMAQYGTQIMGPRTYAPSVGVKGYSLHLQRIGQGVHGNFSVTLNKPISPNIDLYVITRTAAP